MGSLRDMLAVVIEGLTQDHAATLLYRREIVMLEELELPCPA